MKEAHHFYPLPFYFRFEDPLYAVSRFSFVLIDLVTLIGTALDHRECVSFMRSAPVTSLRQCTLLLLETLDRNFPIAGTEAAGKVETWRYQQSYSAAIAILAGAGLSTGSDGVDRYVAERRDWEPLAERVAPTLGYGMDEIDMRRPAGQAGTLSFDS